MSSKDPGFVSMPFHEPMRRSVRRPRSMTLIVGPPAVGKSTFAREVSIEVSGREPEVLDGHAGTDELEVWGRGGLKGGETCYVPGPAHVAAREGRVLLIEELTYIPQVQLAVFLSLRERTTVRNLVSGEEVQVHPEFRVIATANPESGGCRRDQRQFDALESAMSIHRVPELTLGDATQILRARRPSAPQALIDWAVSTWADYRGLGRRGRNETTKQLCLRAALTLLDRVLEGEERAAAIEVALVNQFWRDPEALEAARMHLQLGRGVSCEH